MSHSSNAYRSWTVYILPECEIRREPYWGQGRWKYLRCRCAKERDPPTFVGWRLSESESMARRIRGERHACFSSYDTLRMPCVLSAYSCSWWCSWAQPFPLIWRGYLWLRRHYSWRGLSSHFDLDWDPQIFFSTTAMYFLLCREWTQLFPFVVYELVLVVFTVSLDKLGKAPAL